MQGVKEDAGRVLVLGATNMPYNLDQVGRGVRGGGLLERARLVLGATTCHTTWAG